MILNLVLLATTVFIGSSYDGEVIQASEKWGYLLEQTGKVSSFDSQTVISIVVRLPNVKSLVTHPARLTPIETKCGFWSKSGYESQFEESMNTITKMWDQNIGSYLDKRRRMLDPYITKVRSSNGRPKRWAGVALGGLAALVFQGINQYQFPKLNQHIDTNTQSIEELKLTINRQQQQFKAVTGNLFGLI